jgi:hypothetical protein
MSEADGLSALEEVVCVAICECSPAVPTAKRRKSYYWWLPRVSERHAYVDGVFTQSSKIWLSFASFGSPAWETMR